MKVLVTGAAGFIGYHLVVALLKKGYEVIGIDNINDYYDINLKYARLEECGILKEFIQDNEKVLSKTYLSYQFQKTDLVDLSTLELLFREEKFDLVINLAAQAGVRYTMVDPHSYVQSNLVGFVNILECCRHYKVKRLLYASSSSVYGNNSNVPFSESECVDYPISLYAATKKSNELMAYTYSHLYNIQTIGLRFFTVYGPWGRPDMAMFLFTDAILNDKPIKVFNNGDLSRDFTYIDDIIKGLVLIIGDIDNQEKYQLFNIGNSRPVQLTDFIEEIEKATGKHAQKIMLPMQPGDVSQTWASVNKLKERYDYKPEFSVNEGVRKFVQWYKEYYTV